MLFARQKKYCYASPYIDTPNVGVGFTYSKAEEGVSPTKLRELYASNDTTTAALNLAALLTFLDTHPAYKDRPLFLAGESYAGTWFSTS